MTSDPDQEYINFIRSELLPSICYFISHEYNIPFTLRVMVRIKSGEK